MPPGAFLMLASALVAWQADFASARAEAQRLLASRKIPAAVAPLEQAHRLRPGDHATAWDLALAYLETGRLPAARRLIETAVTRQDRAEWHSLWADVEERAGDPSAAARQHQRAAEMEPSEQHLLAFGNHLTKYNATPSALELYRHAVERYPRSGPLHVGFGVALHAASRHDEAVAVLCQAVDLAPADPRPIYFLGQLHDVSPALAAQVSRRLERFTQLYPKNAAAQHFFALSLLKREPREEKRAEAHFLQATRLDPRNSDTWLQLGMLHQRAGHLFEAEKAWRQAVTLQPESESAHYRLAQLYQSTGRTALAKQELATYERLHERQLETAKRGATALQVR